MEKENGAIKFPWKCGDCPSPLKCAASNIKVCPKDAVEEIFSTGKRTKNIRRRPIAKSRRVNGATVTFGVITTIVASGVLSKLQEVNAFDIFSEYNLPLPRAQTCKPSDFVSRESDLGYKNVYYFPGELDSFPAYQEGRANYYGGGEKLNARTSSGEVFNPQKMAAASWFYPLGTHVTVTDLRTGNNVTVVINDRGPNRIAHPNVIIDLTQGAMMALTGQAGSANSVSVTPFCR